MTVGPAVGHVDQGWYDQCFHVFVWFLSPSLSVEKEMAILDAEIGPDNPELKNVGIGDTVEKLSGS